MKTETLENVIRLACFLDRVNTKDNPEEIRRDCIKLGRLAETSARLGVLACNRLLTPYEKKRVEETDHKIKVLAERRGCTVEDGDPRGFIFRLHREGLGSNDFGGEGFGLA